MEGLEQQISQLLSDPNSVKQLQGMIHSLGLNQPQSAPQPQAGSGEQGQQSGNTASPDLSALAGMLGALGGMDRTPTPPAQSTALAAPDTIAMVTKLAPLLSQLNREDESTRLLRALRPLLGAERQRKIDEAVKILQLMRLLPMLRDVGGLPGLLG